MWIFGDEKHNVLSSFSNPFLWRWWHAPNHFILYVSWIIIMEVKMFLKRTSWQRTWDSNWFSDKNCFLLMWNVSDTCMIQNDDRFWHTLTLVSRPLTAAHRRFTVVDSKRDFTFPFGFFLFSYSFFYVFTHQNCEFHIIFMAAKNP